MDFLVTNLAPEHFISYHQRHCKDVGRDGQPKRPIPFIHACKTPFSSLSVQSPAPDGCSCPLRCAGTKEQRFLSVIINVFDDIQKSRDLISTSLREIKVDALLRVGFYIEMYIVLHPSFSLLLTRCGSLLEG